MSGFAAYILGRKMYGPIRGDWNGTDWRGWWRGNPLYHALTFILTHHAHSPIEMEGGTTFIFVTDGIKSALRQVKAEAGYQDIKIGGGVSTVPQYLAAGLIDELYYAVSPVILGRGEAVFEGLNLPALGYGESEQGVGEKSAACRSEQVTMG